MYHVVQGINLQVCVRLMEPGAQSSDVIEVINYKNEPVSIYDNCSLLKLYNTLRKDMKLKFLQFFLQFFVMMFTHKLSMYLQFIT